MSQIVKRDTPEIHGKLEASTRMLEQIAQFSGPYVQGMFYSLLCLLCVQTWTVIEALLEDLHKLSREKHEPSFKPEALSAKYYFRRRRDARKAFDVLFDKDASINGTLNHQSIDSLAEIRNLLVHRQGKVDKTFIEAAQQFTALHPFTSCQEGDDLPIDGKITREVLAQAIDQGFQLILDVDKWLWESYKRMIPPP